MTEPILRMTGISKGFPGVQALQDVNLEVRSGEVLVLVGENGAGKSTLMKILSGIYTRDEGTIHFEGQPVELTSPLQAQQLGITIIHQELNMMPDLTVAQNIYIGREPKTGPFLSERALNKQTDELLARLGIRLDARQKVGELTVAEQQMVEIAKALSFNAKVLIMDEPTSALTDTEVETLFVLIEQLKQRGTGIVYISHRMDELRRLADRVSVLRDGAYIGSLEKSEISIPRIIEMMVGRAIDEGTRPEAREHLDDPVVLDVQGLSRIWADILKRPYITIGMAGFLCLVPLAATSNNWSLRKLGARWRKLHRLTYVAALLAALHFLWLAKGFQLEPLVYAGLVAGLLIYRLPLSGLWQKGPRGWATRKGQQRS